jgi:hypothetical protein
MISIFEETHFRDEPSEEELSKSFGCHEYTVDRLKMTCYCDNHEAKERLIINKLMNENLSDNAKNLIIEFGEACYEEVLNNLREDL